MIEIRRILCPIDFSDFSRRALDHAIAIARWYEASVTVLHVFSSVPVAMGAGPMVFEPILLPPVDRDQLLADTKAFAEMEAAGAATWVTDCPLAAIQLRQFAGREALHPMTVLARAYRGDPFPAGPGAPP